MMKIGVGVTCSTKRPEHQQYWIERFNEFTEDVTCHMVFDAPAVSHGKNEILRKFKDFDHIFLFDDDCFPIAKGWEKFIIDHATRTGIHHFTYLHNTPKVRKIGETFDIEYYNNSLGCFMYLSREAVEKVGAFDEGFGRYGFEHADYSERVRLAGLAPHRNMTPKGITDYIYSLDIDNWMELPFKHIPTLSGQEVSKSVADARDYLEKREQKIYIPL